jgi:hypothetical protein
MGDWFGTNLELEDFENLLKADDLAQEPIPLQRFVTDRHYLGLEFALSDIQLEIARHITQVFKPETLLALDGTEFLGGMSPEEYYRRYTVNEVICQVGKGAGKDHTSRISMAYIGYLMHCLRDPLKYYGKASGVYVDLVNLAVNAKQAQQVFFDPLKNILLRSPWANEVGFEPRVQEIFWFDRPVRMFSGHSEAEGWEGYEVMVVVLDEISAFKTDVELKGDLRNKGSASVIYEMARASITSRFPDVGKVVLLSFPRFKNDFIQQRYKSVIDDLVEQGVEVTEEKWGNKGVERERKTWALKAATWDVNPTRKREEFDDEFRRDPIMARARYECEPPEMEDAYFRDVEAVRSAFMIKPNPVNEEGHYAEWFRGNDQHNRYIHIDLGLKRDRAALGMVHCPGLKEIKTRNGVEKLPIIEMDFLQSWEALPYQEIPFAEVRNVIVDLSRRFSVASVTFDQWQSADMIQSLRSLGINADLHTVKKTDYDTLSTSIYDRRFRGYWNELLVEEELLKLKLINNTKIDHPSTGSKDLADAIAGATFMCLKELTTDIEIEIEVLQAVDYDELTNESIDMVQRYKGSVKHATDVNKEMPQDIAEWLSGLEMI